MYFSLRSKTPNVVPYGFVLYPKVIFARITFSILVLDIQRSADFVDWSVSHFYDVVVTSFLFPFFWHEMQTLGIILKDTRGLSNQILDVTWSEFQEGLLNVGNLGMI